MSELIEWRDEFKTGSEQVDSEHHEMIDWINRVDKTLGGTPAHDEISDFLGEIFVRIAAHFALEERLMRSAKYPEYVAHKDDHEALLDDIRDIMDEFDANADGYRAVLSERLDRWFSVHFRTHDARLHGVLG
jgi:hemerythrin